MHLLHDETIESVWLFSYRYPLREHRLQPAFSCKDKSKRTSHQGHKQK